MLPGASRCYPGSTVRSQSGPSIRLNLRFPTVKSVGILCASCTFESEITPMQVTNLFNSCRNRLLILVAAFVFVFTQTIDLQHSHGGDLELQADCQICLKLGSHNDISLAGSVAIQAESAETQFQSTVLDLDSGTSYRYNPRGPPRSFS